MWVLNLPSDGCSSKHSVHFKQQILSPASCLAHAEIKFRLIHSLLLTGLGPDT